MSSATLSKSMIEAQQAYLDGNFLEAHSLFLDLAKETIHRGFSLLNCVCRAYLLLTEYKTGGKPKIIEKHLNELAAVIEDLGGALESIEIAKEFNFVSSELLNLRKYPEAIFLLKIALRIAKNARSLIDLKISTYNLSYAYLGSQKLVEGAKLLGIAANLEDDFLKAGQGIKRSVEIYTKINAIDQASTLLDDSLNKWKEDKAAVNKIHYLKAELGKKMLAQVAISDSVDQVRSLVAESLESCEQAGDGKLLCETLYQAGVALDTLEEPEREAFWKKALDVSLRFSSKDVFIRSSVSLAFLSIDEGRSAEAIPLLEDALEIAQDMRNQAMVERIKAILSSIEKIIPAKEEADQFQESTTLSTEESMENSIEALLDVEPALTEMELGEEGTEESDKLPQIPEIPAVPSEFERIVDENAAEATSSEPMTLPIVNEELSENEIALSEITREMVGNFLVSEGYSVSYDQEVDGTTIVDILAIKGKRRRRKNLFILFSETPGDAKIGSFLLNRLEKSGKKVIFLSNGTLAEVGRVGKEIMVITDLLELRKL